VILTATIPDRESHRRLYERGLTKYAYDEIVAVLTEATEVKGETAALLDQAGKLLDGVKFWGVPEHLKNLYSLTNSCNEGAISSRRNSSEPYPVITWQREIARERRYIAKLNKAMTEAASAEIRAKNH
jgi:hypothetical protein